MASPLTEAQIEAKQRLQRLIVALVGASWAQLGHYDRQQVDQWLTTVLPLVAAAKQQSAALTQAYLARALDTAPPALDVQSIIAGIRNGATPQEVYTRPFITVWGALKRGVPWTQAVQMGRERAVAAAAMDVQLTFTHTVRAFGSVNDRIAGWQRVPDSSACDFCRAAADLIYHTGDLMPLHTWCVTGDTLVSVPAGVAAHPTNLRGSQAVTRRRHAGEVVMIETAGGSKLTVTPNHPILTGGGWAAAHLLREGDGVIRHAGPSGIDAGVPHEQHVPTRIEERFRAGTVATSVAVPFGAEHFHGDIGDGEVHVVSPDGDLDARALAALLEPFEHPALGIRFGQPASRARLCSAHESLFGGLASSRGGVRRGHAGEAYLGGLLGGAHSILLGGSSQLDAVQSQVSADRAPTDAVALREREYGLAGEISLDSIRHTRRVSWAGHVFNLVTEPGWYIANGIVTHNCGCGVAPLGAADLRGPVLRLPDTFSAGDGTTVAIHQHGELGPVLTNAADHFTSQGDLPGHSH